VRPSPARVEAPEPDVWLPILGITGELEALDLTAELEALDLEVGRAHFDAELHALEADFWRTAPADLEEAVAQIRFVEPAEVRILVEPVAEPAVSEPSVDVEPTGPMFGPPAPEQGTAAGCPAPAAAAIGRRRFLGRAFRLAVSGTDVRTRLVGTVLVLALLGTLATAFPTMVGASVPQRYVTISLDGQTVARSVRLATVGAALAHEHIVVHPGDAVLPPARTDLREGMHIRVVRSFPIDVDVDGVVTTMRTTLRSTDALRRSLGVPATLVATTTGALTAGSTVAFRTPHDVTVQADGTTVAVPHSTALDVAALLRERHIALGSHDEVTPAASARLTNGMHVEVFRLADNQVAERVFVPFTTETRDDPNLPVGQSRTIQAGEPGVRRDLFQVTTRGGNVVAKQPIGTELLTPPVAQVVVKGTQPIAPRATGSATWYGTAPGRGTCAHLSLPFGTIVTITNRATGAVAQCRVADRGPEAWTGHIIDLAPDVFRRLAPLGQGVASVSLSY
jgi:uncharacterized protein YabE (DUF348 family)